MALRFGVAIGGFMGVGKSTVGRSLAARLGLPFIDTDEVLVERFGPIAAQFAEGEAVFRAREAALVAELCDGTPRVLATGGGTWVDPENRRRVAAHYRTVVLTAPIAVLRARVAGSGRPLWDESVQDRLAARQAAYADAELHIDTSTHDVAAVVEEIATWIG